MLGEGEMKNGGDQHIRWFGVCGMGGYACYVTLKRGVFPMVFSPEYHLPGLFWGTIYLSIWGLAALSCLWMVYFCSSFRRSATTEEEKQREKVSGIDVPLWMTCDACLEDFYRPVEHNSIACICISCGSQAHKCLILYFFYCSLSLLLSGVLLVDLPLEAFQNPFSFWSLRVFILCLVYLGLTIYMASRTFMLFFLASLNVTPLEWAILHKEYKLSPLDENGTPYPPSPPPLPPSPSPPPSQKSKIFKIFLATLPMTLGGCFLGQLGMLLGGLP